MGCITSRNSIKIHLKPGNANREVGVPGKLPMHDASGGMFVVSRAGKAYDSRGRDPSRSADFMFPKDDAMKKEVVCGCHPGVSRRTVLQGGLAAAAVSSMSGVSNAPLADPAVPSALKTGGARAIDIHAHY